MKLRRYFELLKYDFFCLFTFISSLIIAGFYFFHYFAANNLLLCLLMMIYFFMLSILTLFFQKKGIYVWALIGANVLVYFNKYYDFTSLILILLAFQIYKKHIFSFFLFYVANTILSMQLQKIGAIHTFLHVFISIFILILYQTKNNRLVLNVKKHDEKDLILTADEERILAELAKGKKQKEITFFSVNIIGKKIRNARERNNIATTEELLMRYIEINKN